MISASKHGSNAGRFLTAQVIEDVLGRTGKKVYPVTVLKVRETPGQRTPITLDIKPVTIDEEIFDRLGLNKTNIRLAASVVGDNLEQLQGRKMALVVAPTDFNGEQTVGFRIAKISADVDPEYATVARSQGSALDQWGISDDDIPF